MKAIGYFQPGPISEPNSLVALDLPDPSPTGRDLLVEVHRLRFHHARLVPNVNCF